MEQFKEYVKGCNEVAKKWVIALIVCNIMWAVVFTAFIALAYIHPRDCVQTQDFNQETQQQSYSDSGD